MAAIGSDNRKAGHRLVIRPKKEQGYDPSYAHLSAPDQSLAAKCQPALSRAQDANHVPRMTRHTA
jgi:hypothetical protein